MPSDYYVELRDRLRHVNPRRVFGNFFTKFLKLPTPVIAWMGVLVAANGIAPVFFLGRSEAWVVLVTFIVSASMMMTVAEVIGFTRLIGGVGHILWFPLLLFLWTRMGGYPAAELYGAWIRLVMVLNAASLVMDLVDSVRYLRGQRGELV